MAVIQPNDIETVGSSVIYHFEGENPPASGDYGLGGTNLDTTIQIPFAAAGRDFATCQVTGNVGVFTLQWLINEGVSGLSDDKLDETLAGVAYSAPADGTAGWCQIRANYLVLRNAGGGSFVKFIVTIH